MLPCRPAHDRRRTPLLRALHADRSAHARASDLTAGVNAASQISLVVPAAGRSERMGAGNKLLLPLGRRSLLEHVVVAALSTHPYEVIVVTGPQREQVETALRDHPVRFVHNPEYDEGMAASLRTGIRAASSRTVGFAILLGDLPFIRSSTIEHLCTCLAPGRIVLPRFEGRQGHPVVFAARYRADLLSLSGDVGARRVILSHPEAALIVDTDDPGILFDIDTMADYRKGTDGS